MKNIYEEPKLEVIKFNIKETIMTVDGTDPAGSGNASDMTDLNPFGDDTF